MNSDSIIADLKAEIEQLKPFADWATACAAINGERGNGGLRRKYNQRLYDARHAEGMSDLRFIGIADQIDRLCGREVQLLTPIQDREHAEGRGWTSFPINLLTDEERGV